MQAGVTGTPTERAGGALWPRAPHTKAGHITSHKAEAVSTHEAHYLCAQWILEEAPSNSAQGKALT